MATPRPFDAAESPLEKPDLGAAEGSTEGGSSPLASHTAAAGTIVAGRYLLESFLGEGGTATVHLARDLETLTPVVVKRMKAAVASVDELRRRFIREARALGAVDHPHVVRSIAVGEPEDEPPYLVLEALRGETLGQRLARDGAVEVGAALEFIRQAAEALAAVHAAGIVHRDIKPDNLFLVTERGESTRVVVLDFGMAHFLEEQENTLDTKASTSILGTAQYMAPEQILVEDMDARTDVYALGVVLFRMVTGHLPFEARSQKDLLRHQLFSPVPPASWLEEDLPDAVTRLIQQMTRKSPDERPETMGCLIHLIDRVRGDESGASGRSASRGDDDPFEAFSPPLPETDVYAARTERGRHALTVLAREFGSYSRPHTRPPRAPDSEPLPESR